MIEYRYCPQCRKDLVEKGDGFYCTDCHKAYYNEPAPAVGILIVENGKVLLARRARPPFAGALDIIGGFLKFGEHPEDAAKREFKEETGLDIEIDELLGMYMDTYGDDGGSTLNIHYIGHLLGPNRDPKPNDDISSVEWVLLNSPDLDQGFANTRAALIDLRKRYTK